MKHLINDVFCVEQKRLDSGILPIKKAMDLSPTYDGKVGGKI